MKSSCENLLKSHGLLINDLLKSIRDIFHTPILTEYLQFIFEIFENLLKHKYIRQLFLNIMMISIYVIKFKFTHEIQYTSIWESITLNASIRPF